MQRLYEPLWQASLAALRADWDRAERLIIQAEQAGRKAGDRNAPLFAWGLRLAMRLARHQFADEDLESAERHIRESPASSDWLAADGFAALPRDANWLPAMFELTEAVCLLGDRRRATGMYRRLLPYGDRTSARCAAPRSSFAFSSWPAPLCQRPVRRSPSRNL